MNRRAIALVLILFAAQHSDAQDGRAPAGGARTPPSPPASAVFPEEEAAELVIAAFAGKDDAALASQAARTDLDPWLVADELLRLGRADEAAAFAAAAPRPDVERLPAYVASRRSKPTPEAHREALAKADAALRARNAEDGLAAIDSVETGGDDVVGVRLQFVRGHALRFLKRLGESAAAFRKSGDSALALGWLARAVPGMHESGITACAHSDYRSALGAFEARLAIEERRGNRHGVAIALGNLGIAQRHLGSLAPALASQERALEMMEPLGDRAALAWLLANLGTSLETMSRYSEALDAMRRSLKLQEDLRDSAGHALMLGNIGMLHQRLGEYATALDCLQRSLDENERLGQRGRVATVLGNLGLLHLCRGDLGRALECQTKSLELKEGLGDRAGAATTLGNLGLVHSARGEYAKALDVQERALALKEEVGDRVGAATTLGNVGSVYEVLGALSRALECHERALAMKEEAGDRAGAAGTLGNLGGVHRKLGDLAKALEFHERALAVMEAVGDRVGAVSTLGNIANVHSDRGELEEALEWHARASRLAEELGDRRGMARTLENVGNIHLMIGAHDEALAHFRRAAALSDEIGDLEEHVRALCGEAHVMLRTQKHAEAAERAREAIVRIPLLVRGVSDEHAASGRSRFALVFDVGLLASAHRDDAAATCFFGENGRAGALLESLHARDALQSAVLPPELLAQEREARAVESAAAAALRRAVDGGATGEIRPRRAALEKARRSVSSVVERIQRTAKAGADLVCPTADGLPEIAGRLRDGEALVLFALTPEGSVALVATRAGARIVRLEASEVIEAACVALTTDRSEADVAAAVAALRRLVVEPLGLDAKTTRVLVSPDGALAYAPFALLLPGRDVCMVPSGTTHGLLLADEAKRGEGVLALGDPDYGAHSAEHEATAALRGGARLVRLPATAAEAKAVGTVTLLGKEATESGLREAIGRRTRWRAIHLACHGLVDPERPLLSSLALSPTADDDGFLTALEVFRMRCPADLVVLSACETGRGRVYRAEGIVGLTRAFLFAGAPRVLVSLWKVDDAATAALMTRFYELWNPADGARGLGAAEALRRAQESVRSRDEWKHPRFWAGWALWGLPE